MTLKSECEASVFQYAPLHKQLNAQMFDEYKEYISVVIRLHRDEYKIQKEQGSTTFVLPQETSDLLEEMKPY